ncbi:MAG: AAA family ATPase [Alphaproteobacteria bacterium]|nr:AAA family ATPase [Alphaproteobacteria bacterium]
MSERFKVVSSENNSFCHVCGAIISLKFSFCPSCGAEIAKPLVKVVPADDVPMPVDMPYDPNNVAQLPFTEERQVTILRVKFLNKAILDESKKSLIKTSIYERSGLFDYLSDDGFVAYYGYPKVNKDDAKHAIDALLKIFLTLSVQDRNSMQFVVNTGSAVITEKGSDDKPQKMHGRVFDEAEEMIKFSPVGAIIISQVTNKLTHNYFETFSLGEHFFDKYKTSFELIKVVSKKHSSDSLLGDLTPLTGRVRELNKVVDNWTQVKQKIPKIVLISGEAGIGKSRIVQAFKDSLDPDEVLWFQGICNHVTQNSAFYTLTDLWLRYNELNVASSDEDLINIASDSAERLGLPQKELLPLLYNLMSMEGRSLTDSAQNLSVGDLKDKISASVVSWLQMRSNDKPVVFVIEDLHFADPSTLDLLNYLVQNLGSHRIMVLLTFRPEYQPSWIKNSNITHINLNRLTPNETKTMVQGLLGFKTVPNEVVEYIVSKTDGIPLFVEELALALVETGALILEDGKYVFKGSLTSLTIPSTLRDSLTARLDLLGKAKSLAQLSSVFGRTLSLNYLRILSGYDDARLQEYLKQLVNAGVLVENETPSDVLYVFKHALIQETAYLSIPKSKRYAYHAEVAEMYEKHFPGMVLTHPEIIALHYTQAGFIDQAAQYWLMAGNRANKYSTHHEAIAHLEKGIELIGMLPPGQGRDIRELPLRAAICVPLMALKGAGADEVEKALLKAYNLCQKTSDTVYLIPILRGLQQFFVIRGPLSTSRKYAEQLLGMARQLQDQALKLEAYRALGHTLLFQGDFKQGKKYLDRSIEIYDPVLHKEHAFIFGTGANPKVAGLSILAWNNLILGSVELALTQIQEAIDYANDLNYPFDICYAYSVAAAFFQTLKDIEKTEKYAKLAVEFATERKFMYWKSWSQVILGWAQIMKAQKSKTGADFINEAKIHIKEMEEGIVEYRATRSEQGVPYQLAMLAQVKTLVGDADEALRLTDEALLCGEKLDIHMYDSHIFRVKAEIHALQKGSEKIAESLFRESLTIAKNSESKFFEASTYVSFYEFMKTCNREKEIIPEMDILYNSFTEGFTVAPNLIAIHKFIQQSK